MTPFRDFEQQVLRLMLTPVLGEATTSAVIAESEIVSYEHTGVGYFVTVRHPELPAARVVIDEPPIVGHAGGVQGSYVVFIENAELVLECHSTQAGSIPGDFREQHVVVSAT